MDSRDKTATEPLIPFGVSLKTFGIQRKILGFNMKNDDIKLLRNKPVSEFEEDSITKVGMKPRLKHYSERNYRNSALSSEFNILTRFLRSNRGKLWDNVYSEILKKNILSSTSDPHVYISGAVTINPIFEDGKIYNRNGWGVYKGEYGSFYVDKNGKLAESTVTRPKWRNNNKENKNLVKISDSLYLIRREKDGVWFKLNYSKPVIEVYTSEGREHKRERFPGKVLSDDMEFPKVEGLYPASLKTLSKKEKKKYKLI